MRRIRANGLVCTARISGTRLPQRPPCVKGAVGGADWGIVGSDEAQMQRQNEPRGKPFSLQPLRHSFAVPPPASSQAPYRAPRRQRQGLLIALLLLPICDHSVGSQIVALARASISPSFPALFA